MNSMNSIRLLLAIAGASLSLAQTQTPRAAASHVLTVCDVLSAPLKHNGHVITIRGRVEGTDEGAWLVGGGCPGVFTTGEYVWTSAIYLAMPTIAAPLRVHPVNFKFDWESRRKTDAKYEELRRSAPAECLEFTYSGLFDTREEWAGAKLVYPNGTWKYAGFGHLGDAPGQLLLKSEDDVTVVPDCKATKGDVKK
jgi:hypothetical protein